MAAEASSFTCRKCGTEVSTEAPGTKHRNHCPFCLSSLHVAQSLEQSDRTSTCLGIMEPIAISAQRGGEWSIVHRCQRCNTVKTNRVAGDDDSLLLLTLALRPLSALPFPLDVLPIEARARYGGAPAAPAPDARRRDRGR